MTNITKQMNAAQKCDGECDSCTSSDGCNDQRKQQYEQEKKTEIEIKQD